MWLTRWYGIAAIVVGGIMLIVGVRSFLWEPFHIPSGSMRPTLEVGDHVLVAKYAYGYSRHSLPLSLPLIPGRIFFTEPERGDVVIFKRPSDHVTFIRRVVGFPGERIQMRGGILHIDGKPVQREPAGTVDDMLGYVETLPNGQRHSILEKSDDGPMDNTGVFTVPDGHYFGLGDNRDSSLDSRFQKGGFIPMENLVGRFELIYWNEEERKLKLFESE